MFEGHPLGQRIIGPRENVERFTADDVRRHFARSYGADNAILCCSGPVEHAAVLAAASRALAHLPRGTGATCEAARPMSGGPRLKHVRDSGSQTSLTVLLRGVPEIDRDYMAFVALLRALDDGMSTRLHYQLADQKGLAYSISAGIEPLHDAAILDVVGATGNAKVCDLVRELLRILGTLRDEPISAAELAKIHARYRYEMLASMDDASAMAAWFGGTALYYPPPTLGDRLLQMESVTADDIVRVARRVIAPGNLVVAAVGALSRAKLGELREIIFGWK
jgi:predicted Zn-dependent peptidase